MDGTPNHISTKGRFVLTADNVVKLACHDWRTHDVIEIDPRNIRDVEELDISAVGAFTRVHMLNAGESHYEDVSESRDLILRSLQLGFNFETRKKSGARRHP